jgi:hypothetical protein
MGSGGQDFRLEEQKRMQGVGVSPVQQAFARNITAAQQLESRRASPVLPTPSSALLAGVGAMSRANMANILRRQSTTAKPVTMDSGRVVGVVSKSGQYSGRTDFNPRATGVSPNSDSSDGDSLQPPIMDAEIKDKPSQVLDTVSSSGMVRTGRNAGGGRRGSKSRRGSLVDFSSLGYGR